MTSSPHQAALFAALTFLARCDSVPPPRPATGAAREPLSAWHLPGQMLFARKGHTATLLPSGKVLIAGGREDTAAEIYDPATGTFAVTHKPMLHPRIGHSATLLPSGLVLIAGGDIFNENEDRGPPGPSASSCSSAEIYDPEQDTFTEEGSLNTRRRYHTANLLPDGTVLIAGGDNSFRVRLDNQPEPLPGFPTNQAEIYEPPAITGSSTGKGSFVAVGPMSAPHSEHTATLLRSGEILLAGGVIFPNDDKALTTAELYDFRSQTFTPTSTPMTVARAGHTAVLLPPQGDGIEEVLLMGSTLPVSKLHGLAEVYRANDKSFTALTLKDLDGVDVEPNATATLLPSGKVLLLGGDDGTSNPSSCAELYGEDTSFSRSVNAPLQERRASHTATLLDDGAVLIVGGLSGPAMAPSPDTPAPSTEEVFTPGVAPELGSVKRTRGPMRHPRSGHTATRLLSGKVLIAGGKAEDPAANQGMGTLYIKAVEIFDPLLGTFDSLQDNGEGEILLQEPRAEHTATLLPFSEGKCEVLIAGGFDGTRVLASAELFNPTERASCAIKSKMTTPRQNHTATLLQSGKVLVAGGKADGIGPLLSAELYDPWLEMFTPTGAMHRPHAYGTGDRFTATLLPSGKVLVVGRGAAEIFDPDGDSGRGQFTFCGTPNKDVTNHTATLLPSGQVVIAGGTLPSGLLDAEIEIVDPATCVFTRAASPSLQARTGHTATLLPGGQVLLSGGTPSSTDSGGNNASGHEKEIWFPTSHSVIKAPTLSAVTREGTSDLATITGTGLLGPSEGSSSTTSASADHFPVALWMPLTGGAVTGKLTDWTDGSARWAIPRTRLFGAGLFFVVSNGIPSNGQAFALPPKLYCSSHLDCPSSYVCHSSGECGLPLTAAAPPGGCGVASARAAPVSPAPLVIAASLLLFAAGARRRARGLRSSPPLAARTRGRCRAGRAARRRPARRGCARPRT